MEGLKLFMEKNALKNRTKKIKVLGINLWELLAYFIIYSILGYVIETLFALVRYGVLESRQSFLYGPFCSIYGIGAIIMIMFLQYFMKNPPPVFRSQSGDFCGILVLRLPFLWNFFYYIAFSANCQSICHTAPRNPIFVRFYTSFI